MGESSLGADDGALRSTHSVLGEYVISESPIGILFDDALLTPSLGMHSAGGTDRG